MRIIALLLLALTSFSSQLQAATEDKKSAPGKHELSYYMDESLIAFVRPGLKFEIKDVTIDPNLKVQVTFSVSDKHGLPLDRDGVFTPGAVTSSFILASIPQGQSQYKAYTTRTANSAITGNSATQAGADSGGVYAKIADGFYTYTFGKALPPDFDKTATHTVAMYGRRNLSEFGLGMQVDNKTFNWVPDGSPVTVVRDVVRTETCNICHDPLAAHGGQRIEVSLCITCHSPQTSDPDTGNTVDFKVMIHKIHSGPNLPSTKATGKPYTIIGNAGSVHDYSKVTFPQDTKNCVACHDGKATQANNWFLKPTRETCGSCHDNVNFYTGENHPGGRAISDKYCASCHIAEGELEFDASIKGAHTIPRFSRDLPGVKFDILDITNTGPGQKPFVTIKVTDKSGFPIETSQMSSLSLVMSGPTTDISSYWSESLLKTPSTDGVVTYEFKKGIPEDAKGSFQVGVEGYRYMTLLPGTTTEQKNVRDVGYNVVKPFAVTDATAEARRTIVLTDKCNSCHGSLALHGTIRQNVAQCVACHNANLTDVARRPEGEAPESLHFKTMIHKIHTGEELKSDFTIMGRSPANFNEVTFPGDRRNCQKCHAEGTEQLPLERGLLPTKSARDFITPEMPAATAACLSCHGGEEAASHALLNTSTLGESCSVCHGQNKDFSVDKVHAR